MDLFDAEGERWTFVEQPDGAPHYRFGEGPSLWPLEDLERQYGPMKAEDELTPKDHAVFRLHKVLRDQTSDKVTVSYDDLHLILRNVR